MHKLQRYPCLIHSGAAPSQKCLAEAPHEYCSRKGPGGLDKTWKKKRKFVSFMSFLQSHDVKDGVNGEWKMLYMVYIYK